MPAVFSIVLNFFIKQELYFANVWCNGNRVITTKYHYVFLIFIFITPTSYRALIKKTELHLFRECVFKYATYILCSCLMERIERKWYLKEIYDLFSRHDFFFVVYKMKLEDTDSLAMMVILILIIKASLHYVV